MTDRTNESVDWSKHHQRENLLYLLQTFARVAEARERAASLQSEIPDEQAAEYRKNYGFQM